MRRESISPKRLAWGIDGEEKGDIDDAYSADRIAEARPISKPFSWRGAEWCTVGLSAGVGYAYKLTPKELFKEPVTSYAKKVFPDHGETARADARGFYHGMEVQYAGRAYVLTGPEVTFSADEEAIQAELPEPAVDGEYRTRLDAARVTLELRQKSAKKFVVDPEQRSFVEGPAQQSLF